MSNKSLVVLILFLLILCAGSFGLFYLKVNPELAMSRAIFGGAIYDDPKSPTSSNSPFVENTTNQNTSTVDAGTTVATGNSVVNVIPVGDSNETVFPNTSIGTTTSTTSQTQNDSSSKVAITSILKKGSKGTQVKTLQSFLIKEGYLKGTADGSYGAMTETAVKKLQTEYNLNPDGIVNGETRSLLNELIAG